MAPPLPATFYARDALDVAAELLGAQVTANGVTLRITEVEAYRFPGDTANHARMGRTPRNAPMWGPPGHAYVYLCYGLHRMLNFVTGPEGHAAAVLIREDAPVQPESPYGLTKVHGEQMLDWMVARRGWRAVSLRYFNPVGAHASGQIGQPPEAAVALVPRVLAALATPGARVKIFGTDWPTADGTCLRDYVHISDLSRAHLLAMECLERPGHQVFNVGTGRPHSVREVIAACDEAAGWRVPVDAAPRREGDMAVAVADPARFHGATGFVATRQLHEMVESAWRWARANPEGYGAKGSRG